MAERTRRVIFAALLLVAVAGAVGLMASALVVDPQWRTWLLVASTGAAVGCGTVCAVLAWRWWSWAWTGSRRSGS